MVSGQVLISRSLTVIEGQILGVISVFYEKSEEAWNRMDRLGMRPRDLPKDPDSAAELLSHLHWRAEMQELDLEQVADFIAIAKTMRSSSPRKWQKNGDTDSGQEGTNGTECEAGSPDEG